MDLKEVAKTAAANGGEVSEEVIAAAASDTPTETTPTPETETPKTEAPGELPVGADALMNTPVPTETEEVMSEDSPVINIGIPKKKDPEPTEETSKTTSEPDAPAPVAVPVTGVDLGAPNPADVMNDGVSARQQFINTFNATRPAEIKNLILNGFTPTEAEAAMDARFQKELAKFDNTEAQGSVEKETPDGPEDTTQIIIDKSKGQTAADLNLTPEEHDKIQKSKVVKLIMIEDAELANIQIEAVKPEHKADLVHSIEGSLSRYSVPMALLGDFIPFKGAQIIQLANAVDHGDERIEETINKKASLIYEKMMNGSVLKKFNDKGKIIMSYDEFLNKFPYQDLDLGIYGILCASSMEESTASITCNNCDHTWDQTYNVKTLMQMDGLTDDIKSRFEEILSHRSNPEVLQEMNADMKKARRFKSPFTGNVYDLNPPSVGRAISIMRKIKQDDQVMVYNSAMALYLNSILIYNKAKNNYIQVTENETDLLLDTVLTLPDEDVKLLLGHIQDHMSYVPQFAIKCKCPSCGKEHSLPVGVDNLVFLRAQDSLMEIQ